jgi:hypothetical protein
MGRGLAHLARHHPAPFDHGQISARAGMAPTRRATLGLQAVRRLHGLVKPTSPPPARRKPVGAARDVRANRSDG